MNRFRLTTAVVVLHNANYRMLPWLMSVGSKIIRHRVTFIIAVPHDENIEKNPQSM
ncbi:hypothetical protein [Legionella worsleiensis]|uniref:hypothetical protein n=1 Tax=Legionella worsleiensis TaxID=45076 RepID=UPI000AD5B018|nr:hypothetical protein [Legionella worsleiensis]